MTSHSVLSTVPLFSACAKSGRRFSRSLSAVAACDGPLNFNNVRHVAYHAFHMTPSRETSNVFYVLRRHFSHNPSPYHCRAQDGRRRIRRKAVVQRAVWCFRS